MRYKDIELMREIRLWIGQVGVPLIVGGITIMSMPDVRNNLIEKGTQAKDAVTNFVSSITKR